MNEELQQKINELADSDPQALKRERGDFQFTDIAKIIESVIEFAKNLKANHDFIDNLPEEQRNNLVNVINSLHSVIAEIRDFRPQDIPNPQDTRKSLAQRIQQKYNSVFPYINLLDTHLLKTRGSQATLSNITKEAKETLQAVKSANKEAQGLLESAKKTTSSIAVREYLGIFDAAALRHKELARNWIIGAVLIAAFVLSLMKKITDELSATITVATTNQQLFGLLVTKLFFLAIVVYLLQQCIRNYMAHMHQTVINTHRENSLKVFEAMVRSTTAPETTDEVLTLLANSIFQAGDSGFFPGKDISKDGPDFIQIVKDVGKPK